MFNFQSWKPARWLCGLMLLSVMLVIPLVCVIAPVSAQLPPLTLPTGAPSLPSGVERRGNLEAAPIRLDGQELFRIASPAVFNRNEPGEQIPVEIRAKQIEDNLERLVTGNPISEEAALDPETLEVVIETLNGQPVLFVKDAKQSESRVLLTVTNTDAQYAGTSPERLAAQWQTILQQALRQAIQLRQPEMLKRQIYLVLRVLLAIALLTFALSAVWSLLRRRKHNLERRLLTESTRLRNHEHATVDLDEDELGLFERLRHHFGLQQRLQLVGLLRWTVFWAIALLWVLGIAFSLSVFPQTRFIARRVVSIPVIILMAWFVTGLTNRLVDLTIDRLIQNSEQEKSLTEANLQRVATIARVIKGIKMFLIYTVVLLWLLQWLNLVPGSILTVGALLAVVISFAVQSLVRDFVTGFLILLEDQFRIGDNVRIGQVSGMVENLNLRITQLRSDDGSLITLPNSLITEVENRSRGWARADFRVEVAYDTDVDRAMAIVQETIEDMARDPEWKSLIYDPRELFGVEQISHSGIVIRTWIRTAPLKQWNVARELRRRMQIAFQQHHIQIGMPQQLIHGDRPSTLLQNAPLANSQDNL